jgi:hypothetical protein
MANYQISNSTVAGFGTQQAPLAVRPTRPSCYAASTQAAGVNTGNGSLRRGKIYDILVGTNGTPADNYLEWQISKATVTTSSGTTICRRSLQRLLGHVRSIRPMWGRLCFIRQ